MENNTPTEILYTNLYQDYLRLGFVPGVDALLDWRLRLAATKKRLNNSFLMFICDNEVKAVDYFLSLSQNNDSAKQ